MAIHIKNPKVEALARELAARTGESITEAVMKALQERLARTEAAHASPLREELAEIRKRCARLPIRDARPADEILGYDKDGLLS